MLKNKRYNVIWVDDKCLDELSGFIDDAYYQGIDITPFQYGCDAIAELEKNASKYDGIILDVKCWYKRNEVDSITGFYDIRDELNAKIKGKDIHLPTFVYSGDPDSISSDAFAKYLRGERLYIKMQDDELLFKDIILAAEHKIETQIRHKYLSDLNCGEILSELVDVLKYSETGITDKVEFFPQVRYVINWLMDKLNEYGMLKIKHNGANINACSVFLGRKELEPYIPVHVQRSLHSCVEVCNNGSHRIEIFKLIKDEQAPFLIRSTSFELLNILKWYSLLPQDSASIDKIRAVAGSIPTSGISIEGELQYDGRNYFCESCLIPRTAVEKNSLQEHEWIRITKVEPNTNEFTKDTYPLFAKFVERQ